MFILDLVVSIIVSCIALGETFVAVSECGKVPVFPKVDIRIVDPETNVELENDVSEGNTPCLLIVT